MRLGRFTAAPRLAHVALTGHSTDQLRAVIGQFLGAGVAGFMALRGDPPDGPAGVWRPAEGGLTYAVQLVELIRRLTDLPVGVAAFPHGHPTAPSLAADSAVLAAKQAAGASFAITQVLYDPTAYGVLLERLTRAGVTLPVIPGVMPITPGARVDKLELYSGAPLPASLKAALEATGGRPDEVRELGIDWSSALVADLLDLGAPGVHFYTLNRSSATAEICRNVGLARPGPAGPRDR
jgi:methylenetetrahydrofolate reductase (NADPH)